jgi:hypothetical protein
MKGWERGFLELNTNGATRRTRTRIAGEDRLRSRQCVGGGTTRGGVFHVKRYPLTNPPVRMRTRITGAADSGSHYEISGLCIRGRPGIYSVRPALDLTHVDVGCPACQQACRSSGQCQHRRPRATAPRHLSLLWSRVSCPCLSSPRLQPIPECCVKAEACQVWPTFLDRGTWHANLRGCHFGMLRNRNEPARASGRFLPSLFVDDAAAAAPSPFPTRGRSAGP